jgi:magnesium chelatase family protein
MLARVQSFVLRGIDADRCEVEIDHAADGLDRQTVVGLPDAAVRESLERVRSALTNAGYPFPQGRLLINLAPADLRKEGPVFDLPIAVGLLEATGVVESRSAEGLEHRRYLVAGELALDGRVRPIRGALAMAMYARERGLEGVILPSENATEAAVVEGIQVHGVPTLTHLVGLLNGLLEAEPHPPVDVGALIANAAPSVDFAEVRGQEPVKRAITIAAAGQHNLLMLGPAGTGKTMMARALPGVLPTLAPCEALEVTRIYSAAGERLSGRNGTGSVPGLVTVRPVRTPHHTSSSPAVIGGGAVPKPGEISLAHRGILFLDELPEFPRSVLDTLRQPLEDGNVTVARAHSAARFPARFMLVAAMNPTARGDAPEGEEGRRAMQRYMGRLSRPLIDRIDIHVEAPAVPWKELSDTEAKRGTSTAEMRERVERARERQRERQGTTLNSELSSSRLDELAPLDEDAKTLLGSAINELNLSARAYDKIRRVSRTIADMEGEERIGIGHVAEAVQYRLLDRSL